MNGEVTEGKAPPTERICPSAQGEAGAILLGIVGADGKIGYLTPQVTVNEEFLDVARRGRTPEKRFRFAGRCVESACAQWNGGRCGVIDAALNRKPGTTEDSQGQLPKCSIRPRCRWFSQQGRMACTACPLIITDVSDTDR